MSAPAAELSTLDALAERAAKSASVDTPPSPALRASSVQRLQLRAGNAAVAAMLQRRAAAPAAVRKPSAALQRKPATGAGGAGGASSSPLQRSTGSGAAGAVAKDGATLAEPSAGTAAPEVTTRGPGGGSAAGAAPPGAPSAPNTPTPPGTPSAPSGPSAPSAPAAPPPSTPLQRRATTESAPSSSPGAAGLATSPLQRRLAAAANAPTTATPSTAPGASPLQRRLAEAVAEAAPVQRKPMSAILEEAKKKAQGGQPTGPEDTASVEGDTDMSDYTDKPAEARAERAANPPPKPPAAAKPALFDQKVGDKPPPKPAAKKIGKAAIKGPKPKSKPAGPGGKGTPSPGEVVAKPAPPLPPVWQKPKPKQPVGKLPPPPAPAVKVKPNQDPAFTKVAKAAALTVKKARKHPTGPDEAKAAQAAAVPPANDIDAQAKANRADTMATAKPKKFDEEAFVAAVKTALAKAAPKSLSETGDVGSKAGDAKGVISQKVGASKEQAAGDVAAKTEEPPDPGTATPKPVTPMAPLEIEQPGGMKASSAMPAPVPNEQVDVREGPAKVDNEMGSAGVSEDQLAKSNEPEFTGALDAKKEGEEHSAKLPADVRKAEGAILKQAAIASASEEKKTVGEANSKIGDTVGKVGSQKNETKSKDELERKKVADHINGIFDKTRTEVDEILGGLDEKVNTEFETGEAQVRASFEQDWNNRLQNYKDDRYSGWRGPFRWARDKFRGLPAKAYEHFELSRQLYEKGMDVLVRRIATIVSQELTRATVRIEQGRGEVSTYVNGLKGDLAKFGQEAAKDVADKFDNLDSSVTDKFNEMADSLAKKYAESRDKVNEVLEKSKAENAGLIDKAIGAIKGVIDVILKLKDMVLTVLSKIRDVIGKIIDDPIGFLKNFVVAVKAGVQRFADRIGEHLQKGLMGWLFGTLDAAGIEIPDSFSIQGIMKLVMSVLGMTWQVVRERMVKKIGEPAMNALEAGADIVKKVITGGPSVLWEMLVEKFTEFEDMVIGEIKSFVMEKVVKAGITWLVSMLNPAAAFIKACKMIYDVVMFFVERGSQIKEFVETVIDAAGDIARGGAGGVPEKIEGVLAKLLPLAISFLANLLGLGGVGDKVRSIIDKVRSPIKKAMDKVIDVVVKMTAPIWKPAKKLFEKGKKLYGKAKDKAVAAYEKGKAKVKEVGGKIKDGYKKVKEKAKATAGKVIYKGQQAWQKGKQKVKGYYDAGKKKVGAAKDKVVALFKRQEKPFAMKGKAHTLIAEPGGKGFRIKMRSDEELLSSKVAASIESLKARAQTEQGDDKKKTEGQIAELLFIRDTAAKLEQEAAKAGVAQVGKTGAPPGFEEKMRRLAGIIAEYGASNGEDDIRKVASGVQVDMALLQKFGLPVASFLQAQKAADDHGGFIQVRAANEAAPKELEQGLLPKPEDLKMKTVDADDVLLGVPEKHLSKPALFLPREPERGSFKTQEEFDRALARYKFRKQEYQDIMTVDKNFQGLLIDNVMAFIDQDKIGALDGGVIVDKATKLAFTGDHDLFKIEGSKSSILDAPGRHRSASSTAPTSTGRRR